MQLEHPIGLPSSALARHPGDRDRTRPATGGAFPLQPLHHLDALWIQVAGTVCNLQCSHCFVSSGPGRDDHALLSRPEVAAIVAEGAGLGAKEYYFTGGEPFVHPDLLAILADTLAHGPCTVLTNGTLFTERRIAELARLSDSAACSLEIRVSLDGPDAATHDRFRGAGSFARTLDGLVRLDHAGLLPIVTATEIPGADAGGTRDRYFELLRGAGIARPRLKLLPLFRLGRATAEFGPYPDHETLRDLPPESFDSTRLQCGSSRAVSSRGVFVCPLLVDEPAARMGDSLAHSLGAFPLVHGACHTCWVTGMTCGNS